MKNIQLVDCGLNYATLKVLASDGLGIGGKQNIRKNLCETFVRVGLNATMSSSNDSIVLVWSDGSPRDLTKLPESILFNSIDNLGRLRHEAANNNG